MGSHLVTGAGSGIGALVARALLDRGDSLVLAASGQERVVDLAVAFDGAEICVIDLGDLESVRSVSGFDLPESFDGVIHCAGVVDVAPLADTAVDSLAQTLAVNLLGPMALTHALLEPVRRARGTHVFVNSGSGLRAKAGWAAYNASKFGLRGFADALRAEESEHGVRVTSVYPGRVATAMQERVHAQEGASYDAAEWIRPETVATEILRVLELGRDATIPDLVLSPA